ncbi:succinate dehydrogenase, hydrophobic membrane anchor protein [Gluconacetobacter diazotrophicus PA1 5]|uniref:Succinate dehydrogenase hydrophobic membrane anchor subunit n=1 Tax=Gluconacetobacter diazotrophicus (strain ATCC 49037 / DSM 5601 / CCUG 37298 / CIP 103539 / LMG 7603 / PAl5) TaxID=272568 RepID=A9HFD9_GLUDA|nr:succinate dehydrogenase, hydrophobic membrane anchor protein [Gluconacetobacter diazotrophicus]ACI51867.1 succinate dehydrogenase, hydrophobic membrane anchor protein [Gluconacetobacter diazotrophicus PA1 5]TWB11212.1 succinate dehydrogenase / fumarate reductase membrane anchor subunit [Gluconacetobacter diazotrophicus]CAP55348.1 putative succinate dehydrogenase hydrophobic membrane anchor protein [Gluconacetobacter diazotrophicus PA1 5]
MNASHTPRMDVMRSQLSRARGLGSAKTGVDHWWMERMSAVALVPLSGWFVLQVLRLAGSSQEDVVEWGGKPVNSSMLLALMVLTFYHMQLGLQVIIDDYVHGKAHLPVSLLMKGAAFLIGLFAVIAVLKLALAPSRKAIA